MNILLQRMIILALIGSAVTAENQTIHQIGVIYNDDLSLQAANLSFKEFLEQNPERTDWLQLSYLKLGNGIPNLEEYLMNLRRVNELAQESVLVISQMNVIYEKAIDAVMESLLIPHISASRLQTSNDGYSIANALFEVVSVLDDFMDVMQWQSITVITSVHHDLTGFLLEALASHVQIEHIYRIKDSEDIANATKTMKMDLSSPKLGDSRVFYVILPGDTAIELLEKSSEVGLLQPGWAWILDQLTIEQGGILRYCDFQNVPSQLSGLIAIKRNYDEGALYQQTVNKWINEIKRICHIPQEDNVPMTKSQIFTLMGEFGMMYDAMWQSLSFIPQNGRSINSNDFRRTMTDAYNGLHMSPLSRNLTFNYDPNHVEECDYNILNLHTENWSKSGCWKNTAKGNKDLTRLTLNKATLVFPGLATGTPQNLYESLVGKKLGVTTLIEPPFVMWNKGELVGLCVDLLERLKENLGFEYTLSVVEDNKYGGLDENTGLWNGLVNELIVQNADIAVAPLTISYEREKVVQFTKPFMEYGATILIKKEDESWDVSTGFLFSFLEPFDGNLWLAVIGTILTSSGFIYLFTLLNNRVERIRDQPSVNRQSVNEATIGNSLWFVWASQMDQGAEWIPNALSARVIAGTFWFVTYILSASYTANLTAFLTVTRLNGEIRSITDLSNQDEISYGTADGSALQAFFQTSAIEPYRHMQLVMEEKGTAVPNTSQGVQQVRDGITTTSGSKKFAYLFDKAILDYIAYNEPCDTTTVGDPFRKAGYGIAVRRGASYVDVLSLEILRLRQGGYMEELETKWIDGPCTIDSVQTKQSGRLSLRNMTGIFVVFGIGVALALIAVGISALYAVLKPRKQQQSAIIHTSPTSNGRHPHQNQHGTASLRSAEEQELELLDREKLTFSS